MSTEREGSRCAGFDARLDPPTGLPTDLIAKGDGDSTANHEIIGTEEFQSPCVGVFSEDIRFEATQLPLSVPAVAEGSGPATAWIAFYYSAKPADAAAGADTCAPSCRVSLHVSVESVRGAQP